MISVLEGRHCSDAIDSGLGRKILRFWIKAGADINHQDNFGNTPMMHAAQAPANFKIVLMLLDLGADYRIRNNNGDSLAYFTVRYERPGDTTSEANKVVEFLERKGVDLTAARKRDAEERRKDPEVQKWEHSR